MGSRARWAIPGGTLVVVGAVLAGTVLASAAAPSLPRQTPAQLLAAMRQAQPPSAMTATVSETANLGFPSLPNIGGMASSPLSAASLISGTHTIQIWYAGPRQLRLAMPVSFGETDLRINKTQAWLWDSQGQTATRYILPQARAVPAPHDAAPAPMTPMQAASKLLKLVGPTTRVTVSGTTTVAGRDAYLLAIAPRSHQSLIGRIVIAVDAKTHLALSLQVFGRSGGSPAFGIGFTSLSFARPASSNFAFTPPPGAKVKTVHLHAGPPGMREHRMKLVPRSLKPPHLKHGMLPRMRTAGAPQTFGSGWLSVLAIPIGPAMMMGTGQSGWFSSTAISQGQGRSNEAYSSTLQIDGPPAQMIGRLGVLLKAMKPVHGPWGSGRLLRTSLLSVLLTSKGEILAGAVTPSVLFADAAKVK